MKVKELIEALREKPQEAEVFHNTEDGGLAEITGVKTAMDSYDDLKDVVGEEFVIVE